MQHRIPQIWPSKWNRDWGELSSYRTGEKGEMWTENKSLPSSIGKLEERRCGSTCQRKRALETAKQLMADEPTEGDPFTPNREL